MAGYTAKPDGALGCVGEYLNLFGYQIIQKRLYWKDKNSLTEIKFVLWYTCFGWFVAEIDECIGNTNCSQICNDTINGFVCDCDVGYNIKPSDPSECERKFATVAEKKYVHRITA